VGLEKKSQKNFRTNFEIMDDFKNCKFCRSEKTKEIFKSFNSHGRKIIDLEDRFSLRKCSECGCIFISNIKIDSNYYNNYYKDDYYSDGKENKLLGKFWALIYETLFKKKEEYILNYFKNRKSKISILDIGCGKGDFLADLDPDKFEKNGVEINPQGIEICRRKNINVYDKKVESIDFGSKKFDVITLWHVLEHLENPLIIFEKAQNLLSEGGVLILQVPNNESLGFGFGREYWFHLDSPRHLVIPSQKTIKKACEISGLRTIKVRNEFYDYPLDLLWSVRKSWIKYIIYPLYPFFKLLSKEHLTFCIKKK
jgi:2-polyprenyl-3-methyl-5-hydroxy-6-metoxy-1,4-benzoquinol methylase